MPLLAKGEPIQELERDSGCQSAGNRINIDVLLAHKNGMNPM